MTPEERKLTNKIKRLEAKVAELEAEKEMMEMVVHDIGAPDIIKAIEHRFPDVMAKWRAA